MRFNQRGTRTVGQHPAYEVLLKRRHRLFFQRLDLRIALGPEIPGMHHRRRHLRAGAHRMPELAAGHAEHGIFERRGTADAHTRSGHSFAGRNAEFAMHHAGVAGHQLIGKGGSAGEQINLLQPEIRARQPAYRGGSQLRVAVGGFARGGINGVVACLDAVGAQNDAPRARRTAVDHAQHRFHRLVADGSIGQECGKIGDVCLACHAHIPIESPEGALK